VFHDTSEETIRAFQVELKAGAKQLEHRNILRLLAAGKDKLKVGEDDRGERVYII